MRTTLLVLSLIALVGCAPSPDTERKGANIPPSKFIATVYKTNGSTQDSFVTYYTDEYMVYENQVVIKDKQRGDKEVVFYHVPVRVEER